MSNDSEHHIRYAQYALEDAIRCFKSGSFTLEIVQLERASSEIKLALIKGQEEQSQKEKLVL